MSAVITSPARISHPHLLKSRAAEKGGKESFSAAFIFEDPAEALVVRNGESMTVTAAIDEAGIEFFGAKEYAALRKSKSFKYPLHITDEEGKNYPEGSVYVNAYSPTKPGVVSKYRGPDGKPVLLTDEEIAKAVYPGEVVRASLRFFGFDKVGKGVGVALNNIQVLGDGTATRFDGRKAAEDEFEAEEQDTADLVEVPAETKAMDAPGLRRAPKASADLRDVL